MPMSLAPHDSTSDATASNICGATQQFVGRERRERVSQLVRCGEGSFDARRRVNSTVIPLRFLKTGNQREA